MVHAAPSQCKELRPLRGDLRSSLHSEPLATFKGRRGQDGVLPGRSASALPSYSAGGG